jgi:hypothetical protein
MQVQFVVEGTVAVQGQFIQKMRRRLSGFLVRSACFEGQGGDFFIHGVALSLSGRADRGLTVISSHWGPRPRPKGRSIAKNASRRLLWAARNARSVSGVQGKKSAGSVAASETLVARNRCSLRSARGALKKLMPRRWQERALQQIALW